MKDNECLKSCLYNSIFQDHVLQISLCNTGLGFFNSFCSVMAVFSWWHLTLNEVERLNIQYFQGVLNRQDNVSGYTH